MSDHQAMKGRERFSEQEAAEIRAVLTRVRATERDEQKRLRRQLRSLGFRISDWDTTGSGFARSDFDELVRCGLVRIEPGEPPHEAAPPRTARRAKRRVTPPDEALASAPNVPGLADVVASGEPRPTETRRRRASTSAELRRALLALDGAPTRIAARNWPAQLQEVDQPGLYSWWVDVAGSDDLSSGLGHALQPGRIYAGQTGATKWPSGKRGKATLTSRIGGNHLRGRIHGSTFRLTLASVLADPLRLDRAVDGRLHGAQEQRLSAWMCAHLEVAVYPFPERDVLGDLEHRVLNALDPPLNLDGRPATPLRATLTRLRIGRV